MSFDGVILSNVLDECRNIIWIDDLERVLKPGGYWFIKMNPYYSKKLESFEDIKCGNKSVKRSCMD